MSRRILSLVSVLWMLASTTGFPQLIDDDILHVISFFYFFGQLFLQIMPLVLTHRGHYGHRLHPVNVRFGVLSIVGIIGLIMLAIVFWTQGGPLVTIIAGSMLFTGVVGAAVLALFADPWGDWAFRQRESEYLARMQSRVEGRWSDQG